MRVSHVTKLVTTAGHFSSWTMAVLYLLMLFWTIVLTLVSTCPYYQNVCKDVDSSIINCVEVTGCIRLDQSAIGRRVRVGCDSLPELGDFDIEVLKDCDEGKPFLSYFLYFGNQT